MCAEAGFQVGGLDASIAFAALQHAGIVDKQVDRLAIGRNGSSRTSEAWLLGAATSSGATCSRPGYWPASVLSAVALAGCRQVATT